MTAAEIAQRFELARREGQGFTALCPVHGDRNPSLGIWQRKDGSVGVKCRSQECEVEEILAARGLDRGDLQPKRNGHAPAPTIEYVYRSAAGDPLYRVVRRPLPDGGKTFHQERCENGEWLGGAGAMTGVERVLYRLPELSGDRKSQSADRTVKTLAGADDVFVVEGEKDADRLAELGLVATTIAGGASARWTKKIVKPLARRRVVILPDNDGPGRKYARAAKRALEGAGATVAVLPLPDLVDKGDVSDWLAAGGDREQLLELAGDALAELEQRAQRRPELDDEIESELSWSHRFVDEHGRDLRHVWDWSRWYVWDGQRWNDEAQDEVRRRAKASARARTIAALDQDNEALRRARSAESKRGIEATLDLSASEAQVAVNYRVFDRDRWLLNVRNGTVDLRTGELRPHERRNLLTKLAPVDFDSTALCPTYRRFIGEVLPDPEVRAFLHRFAGYCLTGDVGEQCLAFLHGAGANGKSTWLTLLQSLLGDYACQAPDGLLLSKRGEVHPTELATLLGRRLAVATEVEEGRRFAEVAVKQLTGGDVLSARRMREDFWDFHPTHKLILAANDKPRVRGTGEAIWRRIHLVPFEVTIPKERRDRDLASKLRAEAPGILALLVRGCLEWQERGLEPPPAVAEATAEYRRGEDRVGAFLEECCVEDDLEQVPVGRLYDVYKSWVEGERPLSKNKLSAELMSRGFASEIIGGDRRRTWLGLGLKVAE